MFMMPMPPTRATPRRWHRGGWTWCGWFPPPNRRRRQVAQVEVVLHALPQAVALARSRPDALSTRGMASSKRPDHNHPHRSLEGRAEDLALGGGERNDDRVVLVAAVQVLALAAEDADDHEGFCWMRKVLLTGSSSPKRFCAAVLPTRATRVAERTSESPKAAPPAMVQARASGILGCPHHLGAPVVGAIDHLPGSLVHRRHVPTTPSSSAMASASATLRGGGAGAAARTPGGEGAGKHDEEVAAHGGHRLLHGELGALADGHHDDHGADADHHAEHGQAVRSRLAPRLARQASESMAFSTAPPPAAGRWAGRRRVGRRGNAPGAWRGRRCRPRG